MFNRKRRASSISSKLDEDPLQLDDSTPEQSPVQATTSVRKKRRFDPQELCQQLYDSIRNVKKEDGSVICETFVRAPKRRQEPSYYDVVANPIDLLKIQQNLKTDTYEDLDDIMQDFELLINNAKAFYKPESIEYQDAVLLWQHIQTNRQRLLDSNNVGESEFKSKRPPRHNRRQVNMDGEGSETCDDFDPYEELFAAVMSAVDPIMTERHLHKMFLLLPSKRIYPDYYDVIEHPIDLRTIATKIQNHSYSSLNEMEKDLLLMTKNACLFNEPGSQIYKDAKLLKRIFSQRRIDIDNGKSKSKHLLKFSSSIIAALKDDEDSTDDEDGNRKGEGPFWSLFDYLYNAPGASEHPGVTGPPLGESLWRLPVRRFHPEYFEVVTRPISMSQIQRKLNKGDYTNISELTGDLYLMLDNAMKAFPSTHRIHKDATKMFKLMNKKLVEDSLDQDVSDVEDSAEDTETDPEPVTTPQPEKRKVGRPRINSMTNTPSTISTGHSPKSRIPINAAIKKKILGIQKSLVDYQLGNRRPIELFMEKPPRKIYPDYYEIIQNPIDMCTIEHNLRNDKYANVEDVVADYRLMFANCRQYNEEGSIIYEDANILERHLNEKLKEFPGLVEIRKPSQSRKSLGRPRKVLLPDKLWQFYDTIRDYQEPKAKRQLSLIFTKLPSKAEYPDYYDIIKEPMDMERISNKLKQGVYETVDDMAADFMLMLENACKYNEPDSQIYKDALVLQQLTLQTKQKLRSDIDTVPDVSLAVQELFLTLFTSLYNHQDEEGRCYSDSLAELPEYDEILDPAGGMMKIRGLSLDLIKRRLDKGAYKRLDTFQEDMFACLDRARKLSRTDSDVFQDSLELQTFFIKRRNDLCKDTLDSPALKYDLQQLSAEVEVIRQQKSLQEEQDQEDKEEVTAPTQGESMTINQNVFSPGEFVYFQLPENKIPSIAYIEKLYTTADNVKMMHGAVFLRPHETFHVQSRKFLEQEVFKSSVSHPIQMDKVLGKCYIMHIRDYMKYKPEGFADKDVFVCESRYNVRGRCFKKFKTWPFVRENDPVRLIPREDPLELKRVMSVFKERIEKHKGELEELKLQETLVEKEKPNVVCDPPPNAELNSIYYQQFNTVCSGVVKLGDFVYVATQTGKQSIAQIHQIWENSGKSYFKGPWLLTPNEISPPLKQVYRQELLLSSVEEVNPTIAIVGRCSVLEFAEYITSRPTEIVESDVFICESAYDELKKSLRKINGLSGSGIRKFKLSEEVTPDEIFYFKNPIKLTKENKALQEMGENISVCEDSLDGNPPSVSSDVAPTSSPAPSVSSTPLSSKVKVKTTKKSLTGYILYSSEVRKSICQSNPDASFGDISRMVGTEWKNLPASIKQNWEDRASRINEQNQAAAALLARNEPDDNTNCASPAPHEQPTPPNLTYECLWDKCDYQFEDQLDCVDHCLQEAPGHMQRTIMPGSTEAEYVCLWRNCIRMRKNMPPMPSLLRLVKHVREVHLTKCGKVVPPQDRSKNYFPRKQKNMLQSSAPIVSQQTVQVAASSPRPTVVTSNVHEAPQIQYVPQVTAPPPEPMFVTVPPRPQRVLHSEAYIKYIESLQAPVNSSNHHPSWKKAIKPITPSDVGKVNFSTRWLGDYANNNSEDVVQALCHLRNFMLDDVLQIQRSCF